MEENRFKKVRIDYSEARRDKNHREKIYSSKDLSNDFKQMGFNISESRIKKFENGTEGAKIDINVLLAYKKKFNVSADWLIDNSVSTKYLHGDDAIATKATGLSDNSIKEIKRLHSDQKAILDKMIEYGLLRILCEIRNLIGYNYLRPHIKLLFDQKTKWLNGAEIDQYLENAVNDDNISDLFNVRIVNSIKNVVDDIMQDEELLHYFGELDKQSKIRSTALTADLLPILGNTNQEGDENT